MSNRLRIRAQGLARECRSRERRVLDIEDGSFCVLSVLGLRQVYAAAHGRRARKPFRRHCEDIGDRAVNEPEPADRDIAMVFQNYAPIHT